MLQNFILTAKRNDTICGSNCLLSRSIGARKFRETEQMKQQRTENNREARDWGRGRGDGSKQRKRKIRSTESRRSRPRRERDSSDSYPRWAAQSSGLWFRQVIDGWTQREVEREREREDFLACLLYVSWPPTERGGEGDLFCSVRVSAFRFTGITRACWARCFAFRVVLRFTP